VRENFSPLHQLSEKFRYRQGAGSTHADSLAQPALARAYPSVRVRMALIVAGGRLFSQNCAALFVHFNYLNLYMRWLSARLPASGLLGHCPGIHWQPSVRVNGGEKLPNYAAIMLSGRQFVMGWNLDLRWSAGSGDENYQICAKMVARRAKPEKNQKNGKKDILASQ